MFSLLIGECYIEIIDRRPKQVMGLRVSFPHSKRLCRVYTSSTLGKIDRCSEIHAPYSESEPVVSHAHITTSAAARASSSTPFKLPNGTHTAPGLTIRPYDPCKVALYREKQVPYSYTPPSPSWLPSTSIRRPDQNFTAHFPPFFQFNKINIINQLRPESKQAVDRPMYGQSV